MAYMALQSARCLLHSGYTALATIACARVRARYIHVHVTYRYIFRYNQEPIQSKRIINIHVRMYALCVRAVCSAVYMVCQLEVSALSFSGLWTLLVITDSPYCH